MSPRHPNAMKWEKRLKKIFDHIDDYLENQYGQDYPLHPARAKRGHTRNKESDGLFNVGAVFSAGYGSEYGPGYVVEVQMSTLSRVPDEVRERIGEEVAELIKEQLPEVFPGIALQVDRDGSIYKIHGDLSLGKA